MDERNLEIFFKSLKVSLINASVYFKEHPMFVRCAQDLKAKADILLDFFSPLKIGVSSQSLWVAGKYWQDAKLYQELAKIFHYRRIKTIEIKEKITLKEWVSFLTAVSLPLKEISRRGGIKNILQAQGVFHISVEELDYSQLLKGEGVEYKDIWMYLFEEAVGSDDFAQVSNFVKNFEQILGKFTIEDFLKNEELRNNLHKFFFYLKERDRDNFIRCAKAFVKLFVKEKSVPQGENRPLEEFFKNLSDGDLADILWEEISSDDKFATLTFRLFSQFIDGNRHKNIAFFLKNKMTPQALSSHPQVRKRIGELLSTPQGSYISETYRDNLSSFLKELETYKEGTFSFDRGALENNYRSMFLNLLVVQDDKVKIRVILDKIAKEYEKIIESKNFDYFKNLLQAIEEIKVKEPDLSSFLKKVDDEISILLENLIFEERALFDLELFAKGVKRPSFDFYFYIKKIFVENKVNPLTLQLIFRFFPDRLSLFYKNVKKKHLDLKFLKKLIDALREINSLMSIRALKFIFSIAGDIMRIEVIKAMQNLSFYDEDFFLYLLRKGNYFLKKEAIIVLIAKGKKDVAFKALFSIFNPLGLRNHILEENLKIVAELRLKEALDYLVTLLNKRKFLWQVGLRRKVEKLLGS